MENPSKDKYNVNRNKARLNKQKQIIEQNFITARNQSIF